MVKGCERGEEVQKDMKRETVMERAAFRYVRAVVLVLLLAAGGGVYGQKPRYNKPKQPTLVRLETNMETNRVTIYFIPAQFHTDYVNAEGTVIYRRKMVDGAEDWEEIGRVPGAGVSNVLPYVDRDADISQGPQAYRLASYSSEGNSAMTDSHETMFLRYAYDSCRDEVHLTWNDYKGWDNKFTQYLVCEVNSGSIIQESNYIATIANAPGYRTEFKKEQLKRESTYYYAVQIQRTPEEGERFPDGKPRYDCWSNKISFSTRKLIKPRLVIDSVMGQAGANRVLYTIDAAAKVKQFELISRRDTTAGPTMWTTLDTFEDRSQGLTIDASEGVNSTSRNYLLRAIDACDQEVSRSHDLNSMVVRITAKEDHNYITFNKLLVPPGSQPEYRLHRIIERNGEDVDEELKVFVGDSEPLEYEDPTDLPGFRGINFLAKYRYYVKVRELPSGKSGIDRGRSAVDSCFVEPKIVLPTAIAPRPTDGGPTAEGKRMEFKPLSSGTTPYEITIYNRAGQVIFHKENEPWTGRLPNGQYAPEGAYVYNVKLKAVGYKTIERTGSLMVVYPIK